MRITVGARLARCSATVSHTFLVSSGEPELASAVSSQALAQLAFRLGKSCRELPHLRDSTKSGAPSGRARTPFWIQAPPVQNCSAITAYVHTSYIGKVLRAEVDRSRQVLAGTCDHGHVSTNRGEYSPHRVLLPSRFGDVSSLGGVRRSSHSRVSAGLRRAPALGSHADRRTCKGSSGPWLERTAACRLALRGAH